MRTTTQDRFEDAEIAETLGVVRGNVVRARFFGRDIVAALRNIVGGEIVEYTKMMSEAREQAYDRMMAHAESLGADAVVCTRFMTSSVMQDSAEVLVYGTAVKLR